MTEKPRISGLPGLNMADVIKLSYHLANVLNCDEKSLHDEIIKYVRENYVSDAKDTKIKWYFEEQDHD